LHRTPQGFGAADVCGDQLTRLIAGIDRHFGYDDRWRELKRHIVRMKDALDLVESTVRMEPLLRNTEMGSKLEGLARFALGKDDKP
jgi:hypothetical protein